jgi:glycosyltransferase involved in cell wall biosynthesis
MTAARRLRVLVSAYACGPDCVSEPAVGWNAVREIARDHDVWVITSSEHEPAIHRASASLPSSVEFVFLDWPEWLAAFLKRTRFGFVPQEYCWQFAAYLKARALHARIGFDVVHHVTMCRYWIPSFLPFLGVPFVWGPVGGGESAPKRFWPGFGLRGALLEAMREVARFFGERDPLLRLSARRIALAVATTAETYARMERLRIPRIEISTQVALSDGEMQTLMGCEPSARETIRFISIGRLVSLKGFHLALRAFARVEDTRAEYWIVGGGPEEQALKALAGRLGIDGRVRFLGASPRDRVVAALRQCDVLVHPTLHDSGGMVCAEAMAAARPVLCLDLGGPGLQVTSDTGIKVAAHNPRQTVHDLARAMDLLAGSMELRRRLGRAAQARVREQFTTDIKRAQFTRWYRQVIRREESALTPAPESGKSTTDRLPAESSAG